LFVVHVLYLIIFVLIQLFLLLLFKYQLEALIPVEVG